MISNENLIEIIVGACKPQIDHNQVDPKQAIACLIGAVGVIALDYNIHLKDHPNFHLILGE